jgi:putative FmdB family regulatory protein
VPTYDYQCRSCGSVTELIHSMLEEGPTVCERCGGVLRRVIYPSGIIFKGSGFYRNDSRAGGPGGSSGGSSASSGASSEASGNGAGSTGGTSTTEKPAETPAKGAKGTVKSNEAGSD